MKHVKTYESFSMNGEAKKIIVESIIDDNDIDSSLYNLQRVLDQKTPNVKLLRVYLDQLSRNVDVFGGVRWLDTDKGLEVTDAIQRANEYIENNQ